MLLHRLLAGASVAALSLSAMPALAGDIEGIVTDENDTIALQSAVVRVLENGRQVVSERDGSFRIAELAEGTYTLEVRYVGAPVERLTVDVPATGTVAANFALGGDNQILVIGQAANQARSLSRKYAGDTVSDVLTRDAIGQFPDQNVAESLRRLPGINVLNDQGEGRFVSVRGLDPSLNATSLNGVRVPSPEADTRGVALDVVSSDIIESIVVKKSLTPDMDADTIGASIEINTVSAFDRRDDFVTLSGEGSYNEYSDQLNPKGSLNFGYRLGEDIGISGGVSYYLREFESDNIEADGWEDDDGFVYAEDLEFRDYDVERERISGSLSVDVRASDTTELYVRGLYSRFDDQEYRRRTTFDLGDADVSGSGTSATFSTPDQLDADEDPFEIAIERDIKDRFERQEIYSLSWGGETVTNDWTISYMGSWSRSSEKEGGSVDPAVFVQDFFGSHPDEPDERNPLSVMVDYADPRTPLYSVTNANFFDAGAYELDEIELTDLSDARDEEWGARLDIGREFAMSDGVLSAQAGFKGRWRDKTYDKNVLFYENDAYSLADVLGEQTYRITDISPVASYTGATDLFIANRADFELQEADSLFDSAVEDYSISEDIYAAYGLLRWDSDTLSVIGGLRWERTYTGIDGNSVLLVEEEGTLPGGQEAAEDTVLVAPSSTTKRANFFAPSLNIRWEPVSDWVFRAAGYRSIVRPGFGQLAPRFATEQNDDDEVEGEFGNPDLKPYKAWNLDLSAEYYFGRNSALTAAFFYKDISDYIVEVEYEAEDLNGNDEIDPEELLVYRGIAFNEAVIPLNGDSATVWGVELGFAMAWDMLPAPFDGIITQANYTYTDSEGTVPDGGSDTLGQVGDNRLIPLPTTSKHTVNGSIGYDKGPLSLRLAGTWRDDYLDELNGSPEEDRQVDSHFQLDAVARFRVTDTIQVFAEAINLTDAEYFAYSTVGGRQNAYQYEIYGRTFKGGVKVTF